MSSSSNNHMSPDSRTVTIAFALVMGAGMATAIGAAVVIVLPPKLLLSQSHHSVLNRYVLASSLGMSAGVMIYVSMIEIFQKARTAFIDSGYEENIAYVYATLSFFAGVMIMMILNALVTHFLHSEHHHPHQSPELQQNVRQTHKRHHPSPPQPDDPPATTINSTTPARTTQMTSDSWIDTGHPHHEPQQQERLAQRLQEEPPSICCSSDDPVRDLEVLHQMAEILVVEQEQRERQKQAQQQERRQGKVTTTTTGETLENKSNEMNDAPPTMDDTNNVNNNTSNTNENIEDGVESNAGSSSSTGSHEQHADDTAPAQDSNDRKLLMRMSMNTAIAIGLHNFPEGLATFVAALSDPQVGAVLAVAIAIHNIPEGLCVALPVYYATGSRRKAFGWAILSGLSEPLAAVFGYLILANAVTGTAYGILFGVVAGMMVMISTRELLPTAHRYDPTDRVVSYSFIFGMSILALSLVLFVL